MKILVLNGPNLNLLGVRQTHIYGDRDFDAYLKELQAHFSKDGHEIEYVQSNHCGLLIDTLHTSVNQFDGVVLNPGGYSHSSIALGDAVKSIKTPVVEVHVSNIYGREEFRRHSYVSAGAKAVFSGAGLLGYKLAIDFLVAS